MGIYFGTSGQAETRHRQLGSSGRIIEADLTYENLKPLRKDEFASPHHPYGFAERILDAGDFTDAEKTYVREHGGRYSYLRRQMADLQDELTIAAQRYKLYKDEKYLRQAGEIADRIDKIGAERQIEEARLRKLATQQFGDVLSDDELYHAISNIENRELEQTFRELGYDGFSYPNDYEGEGISYVVFGDDQINQLESRTYDGRWKEGAAGDGHGDTESAGSYSRGAGAVQTAGRPDSGGEEGFGISGHSGILGGRQGDQIAERQRVQKAQETTEQGGITKLFSRAKGSEETSVTPTSIGAMELNPARYSNMQNTYGTIAPGENPSRVVDVPASTNGSDRVSRLARTAMKAEATPDSMLKNDESNVEQGLFSYKPKSDKAALNTAVMREDYYNGFTPEVRSMASSSVIGLESSQVSNTPLKGTHAPLTNSLTDKFESGYAKSRDVPSTTAYRVENSTKSPPLNSAVSKDSISDSLQHSDSDRANSPPEMRAAGDASVCTPNRQNTLPSAPMSCVGNPQISTG